MQIGLIADTHDQLDPRVTERFAGVDHIVHAGDVCRPRLIAELETIAPVTVVLGNNDNHLGWRETELLELGGRRILVQHIVTPDALSSPLRHRLGRSRAEIVIFGHTHRAFARTIDGVLFVNPGSAGAARFGLPRSLGRLHLTPAAIRTEFLDLDGRPLTL